MFATVSAYTVLAMISVFAVILFFIILQLIGATRRHYNDPLMPPKPKRQKVLLLSLTIIGVILFECSVIIIAGLLLELILVDHDILHKAIRVELEYLILILDATGHITIIYAFSVRFVYCFSGTLSRYYKRLVLALRGILFLLVLLTLAVLVLMVLRPTSTVTIFALEFSGEFLLHSVALCLFYLFVAHSYRLITMSFPKSNQFRDFIRHLSNSYQHKKELETSSRTGSTTGSQHEQPHAAMTIDGVPAMPVRSTKPRKSDADTDQYPEETPTSTLPKSKSKSKSKKKRGTKWVAPGHSDPVDLVHVMNRKMLLGALVIVSTISNGVVVMLSMVQTSGRLADAQTIWLFFMLVLDMLFTTLMLYLQFTFNHELYFKVCHRLDLALMKVVLNMIKCIWRREHMHAHDMMQQMNEMDNYKHDRDEVTQQKVVELHMVESNRTATMEEEKP